MTDDQINSFVERFVLSFEKIAVTLEGLCGTYQKQFIKPEREVREAIVTRVPNEEDRLRAAQGASDQPLRTWLNELDEEEKEEDIGVREKQWLSGFARSDAGGDR